MTQTKSIAAMLCVLALAGCGPSLETGRVPLGQATLDAHALDANDPAVRRAAAMALTDQALLAKFAAEAEDSDARYAANQRLAELQKPQPTEPAGARAGVPAAPDPQHSGGRS